MRYAKNCEEIMVYSFYKILEKDEYRYIIIGWEEGVELEDFDELKARELWNQIYNEYCKLSQDSKTLLFFELTCELIYLENRLYVSTVLVDLLEAKKDSPEAILLYSEALTKWKHRVNPENDIDLEIAKVRKNLKGSENKIRLKKDEIEGLKEDQTEEPMSLARILIKMEQALNRNEINPKTTSMLRFLEMMNEITERNQIRSRKHGSELSTVD